MGSHKPKLQRGRGFKPEIHVKPSVVGVWLFSGTTYLMKIVIYNDATFENFKSKLHCMFHFGVPTY